MPVLEYPGTLQAVALGGMEPEPGLSSGHNLCRTMTRVVEPKSVVLSQTRPVAPPAPVGRAPRLAAGGCTRTQCLCRQWHFECRERRLDLVHMAVPCFFETGSWSLTYMDTCQS